MLRFLLFFAFVLPTSVAAQVGGVSQCLAIANTLGPERVFRAAYSDPVEETDVRIRYVDHAMFLIQSAGAAAATDYTGFLGMPDFVPDVVTMNNSHESHWTSYVDDRIPHVLRGWPDGDQPAQHWIKVDDMVVRNVTSDTRSRFGAGTNPNGNSIFVFEVAGMCIGHLGHLHHELTEEQYSLLGHLDIVMVPVDGGATLPHESVIRIMKRLRASVILPMHWFSLGGREAFLNAMANDFVIDRSEPEELTFNLNTLPRQPTVIVMKPDFIRTFDDFE